MRKAFPILIAILIVAGLAYAFWPKPIAVDQEPVTQGSLIVTVDEEGKTRIKERYVVSAPLAGQLRRIELEPGDAVEAGKTLLAVIEPVDPALLDQRAVAESEAAVKAKEASVSQSLSNIERAKASLEYAQSDHKRARALQEKRQVTLEQLEDAELLVRTRTEDLKAAEFALQIAEFELQQAQAALLRAKPDGSISAEDRQIEIRAPINGRVLHVFQKSAAIVTPGEQLVELGDPHDLEVEIDVLSSDAVKIKAGDRVMFEHWGGEQPLAGRVRLVEPAGFTKVSALGVEEQRVYVLADFVDPFEKRSSLGDAYRVETRIVVWQGDNVVTVPASALFRQGDSWAVYRVNDARAHLTKIDIGHSNTNDAEVLAGLKPGDVVITHPGDKISDGVRVVKR